MPNLFEKIASALVVESEEEYFDEAELQAGIEIEKEHNISDDEAKKVATDHLKEDPKYYTKLKQAGL